LSYRLELTRDAQRDLDRLPRREMQRVSAALATLADQPRPRGVLKLGGRTPPQYRMRVERYRVIYAVADDATFVRINRVLKRDTHTYD
jgi:mRNA interferase RelE/StbE